MSDEKSFEISTTQVLGAALAGLTAAYVGSFLGVTGTITGTALTTAVITVCQAFYQRWLDTTQEKAIEKAAQVLPRTDGHEREREGATEETEAATPSEAEGQEPSRRRGIRWGRVVVATVAAFLVAMAVLTAFEGVLGRALSGSGHRTTVSGVVSPGSRPEPVPGEGPASEQPQPSWPVEIDPPTPFEPPAETPPLPTGDGDEQQPGPTVDERPTEQTQGPTGPSTGAPHR